MMTTTTRHRLASAIVAATICLVTAGVSAQPAKSMPQKEQRQVKDKLRKAMLNALKDPDSAKTRDEFLSWSDNADSPTVSLCGQLNAKNSYGGYQGFSRYMVAVDGRVTLEATEPPGAFDHIWPIWCGRPM